MKRLLRISRKTDETPLELTFGERVARFRKPFALFLAVAAGVLVLSQNSAESVDPVAVVVAAEDIPLGTTLSADNVVVRELHLASEHQVKGLFEDPALVVGQQTAIPLSAGTPVVEDQFVGPPLLKALPAGVQAVMIRPNDQASAQVIAPGMRLDLLLPAAPESGRSDSEPIARDVQVLFNSSFNYVAEDQEQQLFGAAHSTSEPVLMVAVPDELAADVAVAAASERLILTLTHQ